jgi:hypothetical protein
MPRRRVFAQPDFDGLEKSFLHGHHHPGFDELKQAEKRYDRLFEDFLPVE